MKTLYIKNRGLYKYLKTLNLFLVSILITTASVFAQPPPPTSASANSNSIWAGQLSQLNATSAGNHINWYNTASGGDPLGSVNSGTSFSVFPEITTTYYAETLKASATNNLIITNTNNLGADGVYFSITTGSSPIEIDGFPVSPNNSVAGKVYVYYKTGTYNGFESNANAWSRHGSYHLSAGEDYLDITNIPLQANTEYSFYIFTYEGPLFKVKMGNTTISDESIIINAGSMSYGLFGSISINTGYTFNGGVRYQSSEQVSSARTPVTVTIINTMTWDGSESNEWNTAANWNSNTVVPEEGNDVIITNEGISPSVGIGSTISCKNLIINSEASLTLHSGGSLITTGTITNNGTINIERSITNNTWHFISSPITNATAAIFTSDYLQEWDETSGFWNEITETNTILSPTQGYSLYGIATTTHTFSGTPNTGDQSKVVTFTSVIGENFDGANLLGNPYPSSIDWALLDDKWGAVYYWNGNTYQSWNNGNGTGSQYIPPMQGFFIVIENEDHGSSFTLSNNDRIHNSASFYKERNKLNNGLILQASSEEYKDDLCISFNDETTKDFDKIYDAYKFLSNNEGVPQLWAFSNESKLSIDVRPETETIHLGFQNNQNGVYKIGIKEMDGISSLILEDTKTEIFHNLQNGNYEFTWNTSDAETRFILHLKATGVNDFETQNTRIFAYQKIINIRSSEKLNNAHLNIVDMMGRVVYKQTLVDGQNETIIAPLVDGVYLAQLVSDEGTQVEKVILQ